MNANIRKVAKAQRVQLWAIADALGISEATIQRRLRHELPEDEQQRILQIINDLAAEREEVRKNG